MTNLRYIQISVESEADEGGNYYSLSARLFRGTADPLNPDTDSVFLGEWPGYDFIDINQLMGALDECCDHWEPVADFLGVNVEIKPLLLQSN